MTSAFSPRRTSKGFTLVELLVVIGIISLLAAILFPVFARARENAKRSSCLSSAKQIGLAYQMYAGDYDERTPAINTNPGALCPCWPDRMLPYTKSLALYSACPSKSFNGSWRPTLTAADITGNVAKDNMTYAYNSLYTNPAASSDTIDGQKTTPPAGDSNATTNVGISLAQFEIPAETIVFGDGQRQYMVYSSNKNDITIDLDAPYPNSTSNGTPSNPSTNIGNPNFGRAGGGGGLTATNQGQRFVGRHFGGANFIFGDGHAKWMPMTVASRRNGNGIMYYFTIENDETWGA